MEQKFQFTSLGNFGLTVVSPLMNQDLRGKFYKFFHKGEFQEHGIFLDVYEEIESTSKKGTIRGLHFQHEYEQDKLVRVLQGEVYDVAVDLRKDSDTFGCWRGVYLSAENNKMLYIPKGFAHGFLALEDDTVFHYSSGDRYDPKTEDGIIWNDSDLGINWPLQRVDKLTLSERDSRFQTFSEYKHFIGIK